MRRMLGAATAALLGLATVMGAASLDLVRASPAAAAPPSSYDEACQHPNVQIDGTVTTPLDVPANTVVLITSTGNFSGGVNSFPSGAILCVAPGGQLNPQWANGIAGAVYNRGATTAPSVGVGNGFLFVNEGTIRFLADANVTGSAELRNLPSGTVTFVNTMNAGGGALITNQGSLILQAGGNLNSGSMINNSGTITSNGTLSVNANLSNSGVTTITGGLNLNGSARLDNVCVLTTTGRLENSSQNSANSGLLRVGGSSGSAGTGGEVFNNNARYQQSSTGVTIGLDLTNNNTVTGFGQYLFAGKTLTQNTFVGESSASPIVLDDQTRTGPIFDQASGSVANVVAGHVDDPGNAPIYPGCSDDVRPASADVVATKTGPATLDAGSTATYTVTVRNVGPSTARAVVARDDVTGPLSNLGSPDGTVSGSRVTWSLGDLTAGASRTLTVTGTAGPSGTILDGVSSTSSTPDPNPTNNDGSQPSAKVVTAIVPAPPINTLPDVPDVQVVTRATFPVSGTIGALDPDPGQVVAVTLATAALHGTAEVLPSGEFTYLPTGEFTGIDTFVVRGCDNGSPSLCDTGTVTVVIYPVAGDVAVSTLRDQPVNIAATLNDLGDNTLPKVVTAPQHGKLKGPDPDGSFVYTPAAGYVGTDSFRYRVCAPGAPLVCDIAHVTINVFAPPNRPPFVGPLTLQTTTGTAVSGLLTASDPDIGQTVAFTRVVQPPQHGAASVVAGGTTTYTPTGAFTGTDRYTVEACDDGTPARCAEGSVTVTVLPVLSPDLALMQSGGSVEITVSDNDEGDVDPPTLVAGSGPDHGTAVAVAGQPGDFRYTPDADFVGTDTFDYQACSSDGTACATATVTIIVFQGVTPEPPLVVLDLHLSTVVDVPVQGHIASTEPATDLTFTVQVPAGHGALEVSDGLVTYTPSNNYAGRDAAVVHVCRTATPNVCSDSQVTMQVLPVAADDESDLVAGGGALIDVRANDRGTVTKPSIVTGPANGTASVNADGAVGYAPTGTFTGHDQLSYQVCAPTPDDDLCADATVHLRVYPKAEGDLSATLAKVPVQVDVSDNDFGDTGPPQVVVPPAHGTVTAAAAAPAAGGGSLVYKPTGTFTGYDTFTYQVCSAGGPAGPRDGSPLCASAAVTIAVSPLTRADSATTTEQTAVLIDVKANDVGDAGQPILLSQAGTGAPAQFIGGLGAAPSFGTAEVLSDGRIRYTPRAGFTGTDAFSYVRCSLKAVALCSVAEVSVLVLPAETPTPTPTPTDGGGGSTPTSTGGGGSSPSTGGSASGLPRTGGIAAGAVLLGLLLVGAGTAARRAGRREHRH
ncbi:Ig-like domain-containing protein [Angustibacter sp. McL0619]|uniref:Ig-like domain-containing protein n=1 Tax=Angustibacter sp. McL0619 TaxID=3415676 RepID=UPI003CF92ADD